MTILATLFGLLTLLLVFFALRPGATLALYRRMTGEAPAGELENVAQFRATLRGLYMGAAVLSGGVFACSLYYAVPTEARLRQQQAREQQVQERLEKTKRHSAAGAYVHAAKEQRRGR